MGPGREEGAGLAAGFGGVEAAVDGRGTLGGGGMPSGRPTRGMGTVSSEAGAMGLGVALGFDDVTVRELDLLPGRTRRWPTITLLASLMPLRAARLAVVGPWRMAMALWLSPGRTV